MNLKVQNIRQNSQINGKYYQSNPIIHKKSIHVEFPNTIQRFKKTHFIPTPTVSDSILRKSTNTNISSAFRPGVNKTVTLNRYLQMFPTIETNLPELNENGTLKEEIECRGVYPNPNWLEWLMGFPQDYTKI